jgi:hypothetical protein
LWWPKSSEQQGKRLDGRCSHHRLKGDVRKVETPHTKKKARFLADWRLLCANVYVRVRERDRKRRVSE